MPPSVQINKRRNVMEYRIEKDTMGEMKVPADKYWGAQTERSHENFLIGTEVMPREITHAFGILKKAAAIANFNLGKLTEEKKNIITAVCDEVISGSLNEHFPLVVWQTGSGTQSNMNANEVIANRGNLIAGSKLLHPNDDINKSQSSNDTFPTAMHIAAVIAIEDHLFPAMDKLAATLKRLEAENEGIVKSGRTHLQDAVPIAFSQEISGWRAMIEKTRAQIELTLPGLKQLALGGTAVGTGLNAPKGFDVEVAKQVSEITGKNFETSDNKYHALTSKDAMVFAHGAMKALAANLMKIANDVAVSFGASQGNFELNVFMPVIAYNFLQSARLLADGITSFEKNCVTGIRANKEKMAHNLHNSLMLVTALNPYIGYENAAKTAKLAYKENISLKEACVKLGFLTAERFDEVFHPEQMAYPDK